MSCMLLFRSNGVKQHLLKCNEKTEAISRSFTIGTLNLAVSAMLENAAHFLSCQAWNTVYFSITCCLSTLSLIEGKLFINAASFWRIGQVCNMFHIS
jgi:hypothetical protein